MSFAYIGEYNIIYNKTYRGINKKNIEGLIVGD